MTEPIDRRTPPLIRAVSGLSIPEVRKITLRNGVEITILDQDSADVHQITAVCAGGLAEAPNPTTGILAGSLMRDGSISYPDNSIAEILDYNGAWLKIATHSHHTSFKLYALNSTAHKIAPVFTDMISAPTIPDNAFAVMRERLAAREMRQREKVDFYTECEMAKMMMGADHPLSATMTPDEIRRIDVTDARHFAKNLVSNGLYIYLYGRITPEIEDLYCRTIEAMDINPKPIELNVKPFTPAKEGTRVEIHRDSSLQSSVKFGIPAIPRSHPDYESLRLTVMALGGYFGSRLMLNIREDKGYTYGISASLAGHIDDAFISIATECDNSYVAAVINEVSSEIDGLVSRPCSAEEMTRLRQAAISAQMAILDSPFSIIDHYMNMRIVGLPADYFDRTMRAIKSLTPQRICETAEKYLRRDKMVCAIAGKIDGN